MRSCVGAADDPELEAEPFEAVFAAGDGLEAYRLLVDAATTRLTDGGVLLLQLDRRLVAARRSELPALEAVLAASRSAHVPAAAVVEAIVEAPTLWKEKGRYYLFFSANGYNTELYAVGYAD